MEAVGATAAIAELLGLTIKASKAGNDLVQSAIHAPAELVELTKKLDRLHSRINSLQKLIKELSIPESAVFFPPEYKELFSIGLQMNYEALENIKSLSDPPTGTERHIRKRLRWAGLDKKRATRMLKNIKEAETELDLMLTILQTCLASASRTSLDTLVTTQATLRPRYQESVDEIKTVIRDEFALLRVSKAINPHRPASEPTLETITSNHWDESDMEMKLLEYKENKTLGIYSQTWGCLRNSYVGGGRPVMGASIAFHSKRNRRKAKAMLEIRFVLLCARILRFELRAQQISRLWWTAPWFSCSMALLNSRPSDSPIFEACRNHDFWRIRDLLECGKASIHDVEDNYGGLLENTIDGPRPSPSGFVASGSELLRKERIIGYLLEQGCNPRVFPTVTRDISKPAILNAFDRGYLGIVSLMESYGADLLQFGEQPARLFQGVFGPRTEFKQKVQKLRSIGFSDWRVDSPCGHLLYGASGAADTEEVLFALEVAGLSPDLMGGIGWTPIGIAAKKHWLKGVAIFIEYGADLNTPEGIPLVENTSNGRINQTTQYLLCHGADPNLPDSAAHNTWHNIWDSVFDLYDYQSKSWLYMQLEGSLAHLLLHNADPFTLFATTPCYSENGQHNERWYDSIMQMRASEVARAWSYPIKYRDRWYEKRFSNSPRPKIDFRLCFEGKEDTRRVSHLSEWSTEGMIYPSMPKSSHNGATEGCDYKRYLRRHLQKGQDNGEDKLDLEFFQNATCFYHHIDTDEGRRQLSRFPLVRALSDALQYAGYRAQMDDDGDIWYDCDDGDRYYNAREYQPTEEPKNWLSEFCPICQRPEWHGLGRMMREAEEGKRAVWEYREKLKNAKAKLF
ncbi:hypothetical protein F5Y04DRAFT_32608 [Hypomontagnella monticulosa]|nr:hypothetical protein F5Y04DRAFT_32608 [Hypomontagnella monticulosa]